VGNRPERTKRGKPQGAEQAGGENQTKEIRAMSTELVAYFDEAGHSSSTFFVALGGCIASVESWAMFEKEWAGTLEQYQIECFHMKDFESYKKAFKRMDKETHNALIKDLLNIMNRNTDLYIGTIEDVEDHKLAQPPKEDPYVHCVMVCMDSLASYAQRGGYSLEIIFAVQPEFQKRVKFFYPQLRELGGMYATLGDSDFRMPKACLPLQAADIVAYEVRKEFERHTANRPRRWPLIQLLKKQFIWQGYLREPLFDSQKPRKEE
jgi:hypothetical protein